MSDRAKTSEHVSVISAYPMAMLVPQAPYEHLRSVYAGRVLTLIGSSPEAHIKLRSRTISKRHALLLNVDGKLTIRDLGSRSLVYVNGKYSRQATLRDGDLISMGRITFKLVAGDPVSIPSVPPAPPARFWLNDGSVRQVQGPIIVIGRRMGADLLIRGEHVARAHAVILEVAGRRFVLQLSSRSPVRLAGHELKEALILPGDMIEIAGHTFQYELGERSVDLLSEPAASCEGDSGPTSADAPWRTESNLSLPLAVAWDTAQSLTGNCSLFAVDGVALDSVQLECIGSLDQTTSSADPQSPVPEPRPDDSPADSNRSESAFVQALGVTTGELVESSSDCLPQVPLHTSAPQYLEGAHLDGEGAQNCGLDPCLSDEIGPDEAPETIDIDADASQSNAGSIFDRVPGVPEAQAIDEALTHSSSRPLVGEVSAANEAHGGPPAASPPETPQDHSPETASVFDVVPGPTAPLRGEPVQPAQDHVLREPLSVDPPAMHASPAQETTPRIEPDVAEQCLSIDPTEQEGDNSGDSSVLGVRVAEQNPPDRDVVPDWVRRCGPLAMAMVSSAADPGPAVVRSLKRRRSILVAGVFVAGIAVVGAYFAFGLYHQ
jgi:pSer/pThr/pTyr-binding forkhead associated (FHA) protein